MEFAFDEEQELLRTSTRRFLEKHHPLTTLRLTLEEPENFDHGSWRDAAELGWTSMLIPAEHLGGSVTDQPMVDLTVLGEELGRVLHPGPFVPTNVVADAIATWGSVAQKEKWLGPIALGESLAAWCPTRDGSIDTSACGVHARLFEGHYILDGVAAYAHGATVADFLLVLADTDTGPIHLIVPTGLPGIGIRAQRCLDVTRRLGTVHFDGAYVDVDAKLDASCIDVLNRAVNVATVLQAAEAVGAAEILFNQTVSYVKDRTQFGRTIASFQSIKHRMADQLIALEAMRAATYYAALSLGDHFEDADAAVSTAGAYVGDAFAALCSESLQLHGGIGFTWEHDVHLFVRRAITSRELYGDPSWHRERLCSLLEVA
jgi:alkylation response protein AidB-like acyl-CoA dehydrogenase